MTRAGSEGTASTEERMIHSRFTPGVADKEAEQAQEMQLLASFFPFCSSTRQFSACACLEVALPADRGHCAGSPESKGMQQAKKAILYQADNAESEHKLGFQAGISGEDTSWEMQLSKTLVRERTISWRDEWMSWLRKLSADHFWRWQLSELTVQ